MPEPELTPAIAAALFGQKTSPTPESEGQAEPSQAAESSGPEPAEPARLETTPPKLSADQLELAARYGLSAEDVKRVRGKTWAEKCDDAKRLAALAKPRVNEGEIAAPAAYEQKHCDRAAWWLGGGGEAP